MKPSSQRCNNQIIDFHKPEVNSIMYSQNTINASCLPPCFYKPFAEHRVRQNPDAILVVWGIKLKRKILEAMEMEIRNKRPAINMRRKLAIPMSLIVTDYRVLCVTVIKTRLYFTVVLVSYHILLKLVALKTLVLPKRSYAEGSNNSY